jgi:hypothetical protein
MRIRIKAPAGLSTSGIYGADGKEIAVGEEFDVKEEPTFWVGRYDIISGSAEGKEAVLNPAPGQPINKASDSTDGENPFPGAEDAPQSQMDGKNATPSGDTPAVYAVKEKDGGWYVITKDGQDYSKSLRKNNVEGFDKLSDSDKAEFADLHKAD